MRKGSKVHVPESPPLDRAMQALSELETEFEQGNRAALMTAVWICGLYRIVLPDWVASAYDIAFTAVMETPLKSWDAGFGAPYGKQPHLLAIKKRREDLVKVFVMVTRLHTTDPKRYPLGEATFAEVGEQLGLSPSSARTLYYDAKTLARTQPGFTKLLADFL